MAGGRKLRVSCGPVATFNPSKQEAKGGSDEAQDSIVLSMSNGLLYLVPELHTHPFDFCKKVSVNMELMQLNAARMATYGIVIGIPQLTLTLLANETATKSDYGC